MSGPAGYSWRLALAALLFCCACRAAEPGAPAFTILFSAEAHGALLPCDCPLQLIGGVARRATMVKRYRARGPVVLVDAGNWAAGGMYDEESDGDPLRDRLRSKVMLQALARMGYDFAAWAEDERRFWNGLDGPRGLDWPPSLAPDPAPLLNSPAPQGSWRAVSFTKEGVEVVAFWVHPGADASGLAPPLEVAWGARPAFRVVLYPFGEEAGQRFAETHRGQVDLIVNGGRKATTRVAWTVGGAVIANFDYQVQRLGVAEVFERPGRREGAALPRWDIRVQQLPLPKEVPEDQEMLALLAPHMESLKKQSKRLAPIEFFMLPECPFCKDIWPDLERVAKDLAGRVEVIPHLLVRKGADNKFRALHGEREMAECRVQAVLWRYYPERFWDWLRWREDNRDAPWEDGVRALGLLRARLAGALAAGEAEPILERDFQLALRRHVQGTPTLVISNRAYDGELGRLQLMRVLCGLLDEPRPEACGSVPACFHDAQCRKRGFIGRCLDKGTPQARCDFSRAAVKVPAVVLVEKDALYTNHERILEVLLGYLPGLEWKTVDPESDEGRPLAARIQAERYPAYLLDPIARTEANFADNLGTAADLKAGWLVLRGRLAGANRIAARPRQRGRADLFVSRFSKPGQEALETALETLRWPHGAPEVVFHDALFWQETITPEGRVKRELAARGGLAEIQEAAIALAVKTIAPDKLLDYLRERGQRRASLFWDRALTAIGVSVDAVRALAEGPEEKGPAPEILKAMHAEADLLDALKAGGDAVLLGEQCELIPVRTREELRYYLELIGKRRKPNGRL